MAKGDALHNRLTDFAVRIIKLCDDLPATKSGIHIAAQLLRCGTAPAFTYGGINGDASAEAIASQLGAILKDLTKVATWLEMLRRSKMLVSDAVPPVAKECAELGRLIDTRINTVNNNNGDEKTTYEESYEPPWHVQGNRFENDDKDDKDGWQENGA